MIKKIVPLLAGLAGCSDSSDFDPPTRQVNASVDELLAVGFPAEADLAILLDTQDSPVVKASDRLSGYTQALSESWLRAVSKAFSVTDVEDALELENRYSDWRLVSARISPCSPLGIEPSQDIDALCWPVVRLVWQPVLEDHQTLWGTYVDYYADDRAIHAIYPVHPRTEDGRRLDRGVLDDMTKLLHSGASPSASSQRSFESARDTTVSYTLNRLYTLRNPNRSSQDYRSLSLRPETQGSLQEFEDFRGRLLDFLDDLAQPNDLRELTAFSLPEGRNPAGSDIWVFLQFFAENGILQQSTLNVIGRESGDTLVKIGPDQTVATGVEDDAVEDEIARGNTELQDSVIVSSQDIAEMGAAMADLYQFLVPNTSCASCHRLNDLRFDFHSLSGFEDRGLTISPRVVKDVERDLNWVLGDRR